MSHLHAKLPTDEQPHITWGKIHGCARGLLIADALANFPGLVVVLTPDTLSAEQILKETEFFSSDADFTLLDFPDWETLPYDIFSPHEDIISQRLTTLHALPNCTRGLLTLPISTCMQRLAPPEFITGSAIHFKIGDTIEIDQLRNTLHTAGYHAVSQVMSRGEFTIRGSIVDFFPMGSETPYRIEFFDDEIETIRTFDPEKQISIEQVEKLYLLPAKEFPCDDTGIKTFRKNYRAGFEGDPTKSLIYQEVSQGNFPSGIEYYLPLFCEDTATLFDYLPKNCLFLLYENALEAAEEYENEIYSRYEQRRHDIERPLLPPDALFLSYSDLETQIEAHYKVQMLHFEQQEKKQLVNYSTQALPTVSINAHLDDPAQHLRSFIQSSQRNILFTAESLGRREYIGETLRGLNIKPTLVDGWQAFLDSETNIALTVAQIEESLDLPEQGISLITESQLFGNRVRQSRRKKRTRDADAIVRNLTDLNEGDPVVHEDHGVGRYRGLVSLTIQAIETEFLYLEYYGGDKLYVPVANLHLISRYTGAGNESAPWHKLGGEQWSKIKEKAANRARDVAAELLEIYARREARKGVSFETEMHEYLAFSSDFPFEETPDQLTAIEAVIEDMKSPQPMDRVVCGDVGFGKTEVAMRAAFIAANNGKQVSMLVPTTLLAQQHYHTFCNRFAEWPIRIEVLSRFNANKKQKEILQALSEGKVDIVIGTHKLLNSEIQYKDLGLLIIDEEQRFGVRHKEKLKSLRAEVDILTLTATPIPRTLNMSLAGLRDLSIIATPPEHRHAIKTFVAQWNESTLKEACTREIKRGGQVYFLHNEVKSIEKMAKDLQELLPQANIRVAHGQMPETQLEQVMMDFYHHRFNILVCTTIIESGIDIPSANTIIINRADKLGLSQLHQLRGRVGRSHHRAYAYMITPPKKLMTPDAVKRLEAIASLEGLGVGFTLATHDLEIRGAGELLGDEQSGQIHEVGYSLYNELLSRAVHALKSGDLPELDRPLDHGVEVDLGEPALLPQDYVPDVHMRLVLYKRIASAENREQLDQMRIELIDRFGLLPPYTQNLFTTTALKLYANHQGILKIEVAAEGGRILFDKNPKINLDKLLQLLQQQPSVYRLLSNEKLLFTIDLPTVESRMHYVEELIDTLTQQEKAA